MINKLQLRDCSKMVLLDPMVKMASTYDAAIQTCQIMGASKQEAEGIVTEAMKEIEGIIEKARSR